MSAGFDFFILEEQNDMFSSSTENSEFHGGSNINVHAQSIAPIYSNTSAYNVGDYVMRNGQLYVCNTEITTPEAWNPSHWTPVNVMNAVESEIPEIDATLSIAGDAADAKAVGDALATKVDKVASKGLSTEDYTTEEKAKLATTYNSIATEFNANQSYSKDDIVFYSGALYRLTVDHSGPWNSAHAEAVSLGTSVTEAAIGLENLTTISVPLLTKSLFTVCKKNISINTGNNLRNADIIYNYFRSDPHDNLTGTMYRTLMLMSGRVEMSTTTAGSFKMYKSDFKPISSGTAGAKVYLKLDRYLWNGEGTITNPPQIYVASYDANGTIWWKATAYNGLGFTTTDYALDDAILTNGNIGILVQFRKPVHGIEARLEVSISSTPNLPVATTDWTMVNSGFVVQDDSDTNTASTLLANVPLNNEFIQYEPTDLAIDAEEEESE